MPADRCEIHSAAMLHQGGVTSRAKWAKYVAQYWLQTNGRPDEFLRVFAWDDGSKMVLNAVLQKFPGAKVTYVGKYFEHMAALKKVVRSPPNGVA